MTGDSRTCYLYEELMLLALRDKQGTMYSGVNFEFAFGAAVLAELLLANRISVEETKKKLVNLVSAEPLGDPLIDECLAKVQTAKRRASLRTWVSRFTRVKQIKRRVAERLCQRGILRTDEDKVLLVFTRKTYPELAPKIERELVARLKKAIFGASRDLDPHTAVLISLAHHTGVLKKVFDKKRLKERKDRIKTITSGELAGKAAQEAIAEMHAAYVTIFIASS